MNENVGKLSFCTEKKLSVGNKFLQKNDMHKFTWVSGVNGRKSLLEPIVMQEDERNRLLSVNVFRYEV